MSDTPRGSQVYIINTPILLQVLTNTTGLPLSSLSTSAEAATKSRVEVLGLLSEAWGMAELTDVGPEVLCKIAQPLLTQKDVI